MRALAAGALVLASGTAVVGLAPTAAAGPATFANVALIGAGSHAVTATYAATPAFVTSSAFVTQGVQAAVVPVAGGPYSVAEGDSLSLDGSGSTASPGATFSWDLNGDGVFGDATGATPTLDWSQLEALGINDGPSSHVVTLRVTDGGDSVTDTASLQVTNVGSRVGVTFNVNIQTGVPVSFQLDADDASSADLAASFTYHVDWGDGSPIEEVVGPSTVTVTHTYLVPATVTAFFSATDKDGGAQEANGVEFDISGPTITTTTTSTTSTTTTSTTTSSTTTTGTTPTTGTTTTTGTTMTGTTTTGTTTGTTGTTPPTSASTTSGGTTTSSGGTSPVSTHTPPSAGNPSLAATGSNAGLIVFLGALLLVCGGTLVALARWKGTTLPR